MKIRRTKEELIAKQVELELEMKSIGLGRFDATNKRAVENGTESETIQYRRISSELVAPFAEGIEAFKVHFHKRAGRKSVALAYLNRLDNRQSAYIAIKTILDCLGKEFELRKTTELVGKAIEDQVRFAKLYASAEKYMQKVDESLKTVNHYAHQRKVLVAVEKKLNESEFEGTTDTVKVWRDWPDSDIRQIGATLVDIFAKFVTFNGEPVVYKHLSRRKEGDKIKSTVCLKVTDAILQWIEDFREEVGDLNPAFTACVVPPKPRTGMFEGGYHIDAIAQTMPMVKGRRSQINRLTPKQMPLVYRTVNAFQRTAWTVNLDVLEVVEQVIASKQDLGLPQVEPYEFPKPPIDDDVVERGADLKEVLDDKEYQKFQEWKRETQQLHKKENSRKSALASVVRTIGQAKKYSSFEEIFFVYKTDSRNRYYPVGDALHPQGSDLEKGLLTYAEEKPLGNEVCKLGFSSLDWFYIVGANYYGWDKEGFKDRIRLVKENIDLFLDNAVDPIAFTDWSGADKPWRFVGWLKELEKLHAHMDSGEHFSTFSTSLRGGQDGSCSGLQHYSAMLRDEICGSAVNLVGNLKPQDIYRNVSDRAVTKMTTLTTDEISEEIVAKLQQRLGDEEEEALYATAWLSIKGGINRSLVKKSVMTLPYGSTMSTCRDAIEEYLGELEKKEKRKAIASGKEYIKPHPFGIEANEISLNKALTYATRIVWACIKEEVYLPLIAMSMIQQMAGKLAKMGHSLEHTSPTGFIFEQKIYSTVDKVVHTKMFGSTNIYVPTETEELNVARMKSSSAPNFIHLYDAGHVTLVSNYMEDAEKTFSCIHDDFETHICDMGFLRVALDETMVSLYSDNDPISDLVDENEARVGLDLGMEEVPRGNLDLEGIKDSPYTFG